LNPTQQPPYAGPPVPPGQQPYQQYPQPAQAPATEDPGQAMGIIGLIVGIVVMPVIGLILCIIALNKSKKAGFQHNTIAKVGIWVNGIYLALYAGLIIFLIVLYASAGRH